MDAERPFYRSRLSGLQIFAIAGIATILGALLYSLIWNPTQIIDHTSPCLSQVKQLGLAALIYATDYDDRLMDRDAWMDQLVPYHLNGRNGLLEHCPAVLRDSNQNKSLYGYAFHSRLSQKRIDGVKSPEREALIYDSINLARNASDPFISLPRPPRPHNPMLEPRNNVVYLDGHVKAIAGADSNESP